MNIINFLLISTILTLLPGQLIRIEIASQSFVTLSDILVLTTDLFFIAHSLSIKKSISLPIRIFFPATLFILIALASTLLATTQFQLNQIVVALMFLVRFSLYFFLSIVVANTVNSAKVSRWVNLIAVAGFAFVLIGFLQILLFPDLTSLTVYGWDPHQRRIVSSFLDPNYAGWIFVLLFSIFSCLYLFQKKIKFLVLSLLVFATIVLTFSRSTYLATMVAVFIIGIFKSPKLLLAFFAVSTLTFLSISEVRSRVIGAFQVDDTSQARLQSWNSAFFIFKNNPLFGVGFNTYRFAQDKYSLFEGEGLGGHSGAGSDSSILLVAATTGIFGLSVYLFLMASIFKSLLAKAKTNYLHLALFASFCALLFHSQFVNSLFFPQIMLLLYFTLGLTLTNDS